ncbi:hypothetical protein ILUMI_07982 [Ignelater luminosus]|uniref:Small integral membrane protein 8 n=1 Tax=Ignelater luminosus TaxID=2038154 RepID=A0A8K0D2U3_IGNLU|nr:hypothetical protein ILUMI_07982 [Ignelater luminosus]
MEDKNQPAPGDGIRSLRTSRIFKAANFELYVRPNAVIMAIGLIAMAGCAGYLAYMRSKYEALGYYAAIKEDGSEQFTKRKSKWD